MRYFGSALSLGVSGFLALAMTTGAGGHEQGPVFADSTAAHFSEKAQAGAKLVTGHSGWPGVEITNQNYLVVERPGDSGVQKLLLQESAQTTLAPPLEYPAFSYRLRAWPLENHGRAPLWTITSVGAGSEIIVVDYRSWFYRTWSPGCCGDRGSETYFDLAAGKAIVSTNASALIVTFGPSARWRFITLNFDDPRARLRYIRDSGVVDSVVVEGLSDGDAGFGPHLSFRDQDGRTRDGKLLSFPSGVPEVAGGFSVQVCAGGDTLSVPVRGDRFDRSGAKPGGSLRLAETR